MPFQTVPLIGLGGFGLGHHRWLQLAVLRPASVAMPAYCWHALRRLTPQLRFKSLL